MGVWDHVIAGILAVFQSDPVLGVPITILMVLGGFLLGIIVGATPGLAGPMAMAISLPILISVFGYSNDALLPVLGFLIGNGVAWVAIPLVMDGSTFAGVNARLGGVSILLAVALSLLAGLYPAHKASRLDPSQALRAL